MTFIILPSNTNFTNIAKINQINQIYNKVICIFWNIKHKINLNPYLSVYRWRILFYYFDKKTIHYMALEETFLQQNRRKKQIKISVKKLSVLQTPDIFNIHTKK